MSGIYFCLGRKRRSDPVPIYKAPLPEDVVAHTKCGCECILSQADCNERQYWNEGGCECSCKDDYSKDELACKYPFEVCMMPVCNIWPTLYCLTWITMVRRLTCACCHCGVWFLHCGQCLVGRTFQVVVMWWANNIIPTGRSLTNSISQFYVSIHLLFRLWHFVTQNKFSKCCEKNPSKSTTFPWYNDMRVGEYIWNLINFSAFFSSFSGVYNPCQLLLFILFQFDSDTCQCRCVLPHHDDCDHGKVWSHEKCDCVCKDNPCQAPEVQNEKTCQCKSP